MGTSGQTSGSGSGTPLVPSWLDEPGQDPLPGSESGPSPSDGAKDVSQDGSQSKQGNELNPSVPQPAPGARFRSARTNFSRFAGSGGRDRSALRRAVRDYVRSGTGGSRNAVLRMAPSRDTAGKVLGVFRGFQKDGIHATLSRLNIGDLSGRNVQEVFTGLTEIVCGDGGSIDEAIARDAWLETIAELDQFGIENLDALTDDQIRELFLNFIAHSIEARLYQEIGVNGFKLSDDLEHVEAFDRQFRAYIERSVRDSFSGDLSKLSDMSDGDIRKFVDTTYLEVWELLEQLGDREG